MSQDPCQTGEGPPPTLCDLDTSDNEWFESGVCLLDSMSRDQVIFTLQKNPKARLDLKRVTSCIDLHELLDQVPLLQVEQEDDHLQKVFNQGDCLPFYTVLRGNTNNM